MNAKPELTDSRIILAVREIIRRAILTYKALPDPDASFLNSSPYRDVVQDYRDAYNRSELALRFTPTPYEIDQAETVMDWLYWLRRTNDDAHARLFRWALGVPMYRLSQIENVTEKTIKSRIDASVASIIHHFFGASLQVEEVDEPYKKTPFAFVEEKPRADKFEKVVARKVYIHSKGYFINGRPWRDGQHKIKEKMLC